MCSKTWLDADNVWLYKQQRKTMCDSAMYCLHRMAKHGYAPRAERVDTEIIRMEYIVREPVTSYSEFMWHKDIVLHLLEKEGIRHGDLSIYSVIPHGNKPYLIDWGESRLSCDPRPDKRPEGDEHWLTETMTWYALGNMI